LYFTTLLVGCGDNSETQSLDEEKALLLKDLQLGDAAYPPIHISLDSNGCSAISEKYCDELYDDEHQGNADIVANDSVLKVRLGKNKTGFSYGKAGFEVAKWLAQNKLPKTLLEFLNQYHYFDLLKKYLRTKPIADSTPDEALETDLIEKEAAAIWNWALEQTIDRETEFEAKVAGIEKPSIKYEILLSRVSRRVRTNIYDIIWSNSDDWKAIAAQFEKVRIAFLQEIEEEPKLNREIKASWTETIKSIKIVPPSSDPDIEDRDCAEHEPNAYYYREKNVFTVCAGLIFGSEISGIVAHEIAHSLGIERTRREHLRQSAHFQEMKTLQAQVCNAESPRSCPPAWSQFKKSFTSNLDFLLKQFDPPVQPLLSCLQYNARELKAWPPSEADFKNLAEIRAKLQVSRGAANHLFFRLSKPRLALETGEESANPYYLNPCELSDWKESSYVPGSAWDLYFFFSAAHLCGDQTKSSAEQLDSAIVEARAVYSEVLQRVIPLARNFSSDVDLTGRGYSEDSEERFADFLGFRVLARLLKSESPVVRRAKYFSNISNFCEPHSSHKKYPDEMQAEKKHDLEPHSAGLRRRQETLVKPLREILNCAQDFEIPECEL
jgi:hypothetical protein